MLTKPGLCPVPVEHCSQLGKCFLSLLQIKENSTGVKLGFPQIPNRDKYLENGERQAGARGAVRPCLTSPSTSSRSNASVTKREYPLGAMAWDGGRGCSAL